jgi:preprotein translocase subunit SecA
MKRIAESEAENRPERVQVIFTDGIKRMRVVVDVDAALENEGKEVARALERTAVLATIDDKWMQHLRELDSVKEGIGLRAYGQKDPLLEYKREAFDMFKQLIGMINTEVISTIWKSIPEGQANNDNLERAQQQKSRFDTSRMKASQADSTNMGMQGGQPQNGTQQKPMGPNVKRKPVVVEDEPGRNDKVSIQNTTTGEVKEGIKWKYAKDMVEKKGWVMVEK